MRRIKELFDPQNVLNPGKVVSDSPQRVVDHLRPWTVDHPVPPPAARTNRSSAVSENAPIIKTVGIEEKPSQDDAAQEPPHPGSFNGPTVSRWPQRLKPATVADAVAPRPTMSGCVRCFALVATKNRRTGQSQSDARDFIRQVAGSIAERDELKSRRRYLFSLHQCRIDCPAGVDIPSWLPNSKLSTRRPRFTAERFVLTRLDLLASLASRFPVLANWSLRSRPFAGFAADDRHRARSTFADDRQAYVLRWAALEKD